jgi:four helix bundle protein
MQEYQFDFEKLEVYQRALEFTNNVFNLTKDFHHTLQYSLGDQGRRAALSICNNIAEGSGKQTRNAKIQFYGYSMVQFYGYSMDSARECIPMISLSFKQKQIKQNDYGYLRQECKKICNMLGGLISATKH